MSRARVDVTPFETADLAATLAAEKQKQHYLVKRSLARMRGSVGKLSTNCAKPDRSTTEACQEVAALQEELAVAKEAATLETRRDTARQRVYNLRDGGASLNPDPVAEVFAWLSRGQLSVREIGLDSRSSSRFSLKSYRRSGPLALLHTLTRQHTKQTA